MTKAELRHFVETYEKSLDDPVYFVRNVLGFDTYHIQDDIIRSVFNKRYTAVRSCHASGKTAGAAACVLAWLYLHPPGEALVITTSSDWNQVERGMWREIRLHISHSLWPFPKTNLTDLSLPNGSQAFGISTNDASNWHGFHNKYVLLVIDEAAGLDDEIFSALKGIQSGGDVHTVYLMNPTETSGPSVDLFEDPEVSKFVIDGLKLPNMEGLHLYDDIELNTAENDPDWSTNLLAIPDTPENDCELDNDPRDYLLRRREIRKRYYDTLREYGSLKREAVDWWARIRGEFPIELQSQLIKREWVERAHANRIDKRDSVTVVGIDVAGAGTDLTAICIRNGYQIIEEHAWPDEDCFDKIVNIIGPPRTNMWLHVDAVAIGWGLCRELLRNGYQVKPCNAKEGADDNTRFAMKKSEWYWNLRELLRGDENGEPLIGGPIHPITQQQLISIRWDQKGPHGTVRIESKDDMKKRGLQSPDRAEALMLAFAGGPYNISTRQMTYDTSTVVSGTADAPGLVGPGWHSKLEVDAQLWSYDEKPSTSPIPTVMPTPVTNWLQASEQKRLERRRINEIAVKNLIKPQETAMYDSNGRFLGYKQHPLDPVELRRLESLLESGN